MKLLSFLLLVLPVALGAKHTKHGPPEWDEATPSLRTFRELGSNGSRSSKKKCSSGNGSKSKSMKGSKVRLFYHIMLCVHVRVFLSSQSFCYISISPINHI